MSEAGLAEARRRMQATAVPETAIDVFTDAYQRLEAGETGLIREDSIEPITQVPSLDEVQLDPQQAARALDQTVLIKLNGGLGTSMGLAAAKTVLPVKDGNTFLDVIVEQVLRARRAHHARLPLILMDSFRTREVTLAALAHYPELAVDGLPLDFLQSQEPKLLIHGLKPVDWPADPSLEWCPPGHGDIYPALLGTGILKALIDRGYRYANTSNADNLGAAPNARLAGWFSAIGAPYAAEVCRRTPADRKGGHLARRRSDGRVILRDTAQTAPEEMDFFTDEHRHPFFHTNNLWFDLVRLYELLAEHGGALGLPLIRNLKTVDPADSSTPEVIQIETAMGTAIELFDGAQPILVGRDRFLPVKTTNDLAVIRSDAFELTGDGRLVATTDPLPVVDLDPRYYKTISQFDQRFPDGVPSLRKARTLSVKGDCTFEGDVSITGDVTLTGDGARTIRAGSQLGG